MEFKNDDDIFFNYLKNNLQITLNNKFGGDSSRIVMKLFLKKPNYSPGYGDSEWEMVTEDFVDIHERLD